MTADPGQNIAERRTAQVVDDDHPFGDGGHFRQEGRGNRLVVMCSLFLHHLYEPVAATLLSKMASVAKRMVVVNDLCRSTLGYILAWVGCHVLTRSPVVHVDGPLSVRAAFSIDEVHAIARSGGLNGAKVDARWPCRFLLQWSPR